VVSVTTENQSTDDPAEAVIKQRDSNDSTLNERQRDEAQGGELGCLAFWRKFDSSCANMPQKLSDPTLVPRSRMVNIIRCFEQCFSAWRL
jgi:hypothetical protein